MRFVPKVESLESIIALSAPPQTMDARDPATQEVSYVASPDNPFDSAIILIDIAYEEMLADDAAAMPNGPDAFEYPPDSASAASGASDPYN